MSDQLQGRAPLATGMPRLPDESLSSDDELPRLASIISNSPALKKPVNTSLSTPGNIPKSRALRPKSVCASSTRKVRRLGGERPGTQENPFSKPWCAHDKTESQAEFQGAMINSPMKSGPVTELKNNRLSRSTNQLRYGMLIPRASAKPSYSGTPVDSKEDLLPPICLTRSRQHSRTDSVSPVEVADLNNSHRMTDTRKTNIDNSAPIEIWSDDSSSEMPESEGLSHFSSNLLPLTDHLSHRNTAKRLIDNPGLTPPKKSSVAETAAVKNSNKPSQKMNTNIRDRISGCRSSTPIKSTTIHEDSNSKAESEQPGPVTTNHDRAGLPAQFHIMQPGGVGAAIDIMSEEDDTDVEFFTPPSSPLRQADLIRENTRLINNTDSLNKETWFCYDDEKEKLRTQIRTRKQPKSHDNMVDQSKHSPARKKDSKKAFEYKRQSLALEFFQELDDKITGSQIATLAHATGGVKLVWTKTLNTTAGRASWRRETIRTKKPDGVQFDVTHKHHASIELADKVIDDEEKLVNVMAHEFCHLANFMISGITKNPHGKEFKAWAAKCSSIFSERGVKVTTKHSYVIDYKYVWACEACGTEYKRHSRSIDPRKHRCGSCKAVLRQTKPAPRGVKTALGATSQPSTYQAFVKEQMRVVRSDHPDCPQKDLMGIIAKKWANSKANSLSSHSSDPECNVDLMNRLTLETRE